MADPATIAAAAKAAATVLSNEKTRKALGWIITAILSPVIVMIVLICGLLSGTADHNATAVDLCFNGGVISGNVPESYRDHIEDMRASFALIDRAISAADAQIENGNSLDTVRIKAIFYALYFGAYSPSLTDSIRYVDCFVTYEELTHTIENEDGTTTEETYTVAVPITDISVIYTNIAAAMGIEITPEDQANASEIYYRILYGAPAPTYGYEFDSWLNGLPLSDAPFIGADGFCSPIGENWRNVVTSEFGWRIDPFTGQGAGHSGIDLGMPKGTPIRAALDGTVYLVRYASSGYGYHIMIDHGGSFVTLYAHCSKILVTEGKRVSAGEIIAEVGSTGRSTGNHLHFEVRINGEKQNPRSYLP
jgi:murein DD-endopeptidase MepM/ murein hydrolase activator NlpD